MSSDSTKDKDLHYTCTGNPRYGSGNGNEHARVTDADLVRHFGYVPRDGLEDVIMKEQLLSKDR